MRTPSRFFFFAAHIRLKLKTETITRQVRNTTSQNYYPPYHRLLSIISQSLLSCPPFKIHLYPPLKVSKFYTYFINPPAVKKRVERQVKENYGICS